MMTFARPRRMAHSRRRFLQGLGLSTALSPFVPLLNASGQEPLLPKRLLLFFSPDGTASVDHNGMVVNWKPTGSETSFALHAIHAPLEPSQSKIVLPWGLKMSAGGAGQEHAFGMAGLWSGASLHEPHDGFDFDGGNGQRTGWGSGQTVDQFVAQSFGEACPYQRAPDDPLQETPYRTLEFGAQCAEPHSMHRMIYAGDKQPIHPETNPLAAFDRLFAGLSPSDNGDATAAAQALARKQAQLNLLMAEVGELRTRVAAEDFAKVDAHLNALQLAYNRLNSTPPELEGCVIPATPAESIVRYENSDTYERDAKAMIDLAVHSLACDLTRVASVQLSRGFSNIVHGWVGATQGHHTISHLDGDNTAMLQSIDTWYATQFQYLLSSLDAIKEGDGSLLDNTLVVWGREMGTTSHKMQPVNLVLAGGARGALATGRYMDFSGQPHAKLLVSICRLMGIDTNSFGNIDLDSGPLAGIG